MKWLLGALALSFLPIWRDDMSDRGICLWEYFDMAATKRNHITVVEAIENYRRHKGL